MLDRALVLTTVAMRLAYLKAPTTFTACVTRTLNAHAILNVPLRGGNGRPVSRPFIRILSTSRKFLFLSREE